MSKRGVTFIKPDEPSFLKRLKEQAGYKEGPTVDTKREDLGPVDENDLLDTEEEQPTIVVLNPGDLTAEEAAKVQKEQEKEEAEKPADLSLPVKFKAPSKSGTGKSTESNQTKRPASLQSEQKTKSKKLKTRQLLSFDEDENDD